MAKNNGVYEEIINLIIEQKTFLKIPEFRMKKDVIYTKEQKALIESKPGFKQIKGVAGSGKTTVLVNRAIDAQNRTGGNVLILTFNITLKNYITMLIAQIDKTLLANKLIEINHYHQFIKDFIREYGLPHYRIRKGKMLEYVLSDENLYSKYPFKYDAIFIDEYQDYDDLWIQNIRKIVKPVDEGGELVLFCDEKQTLYERDSSKEKFISKDNNWEVMPPRDFRGNVNIATMANAFQNKYLKSKYEFAPVKISNKASSDDFASISYLFCEDIFDDNDLFPQKVYNFIQNALNVNIKDVCFIAKEGEQLRLLNDFFNKDCPDYKNTNTMVETTEEYKELAKLHSGEALIDAVQKLRRPLKEKFFGVVPKKITLSTIASFKGWEADTVCLLLSKKDKDRQKEETIYTGLTRARKHLIIINDNTTYDNFFRTNLNSSNVYNISGPVQDEMPF